VAARSTLRASDADRERIAERLRHAAAEGRILAEELEERLELAFTARTYGELDAVVADLPGKSVAPRPRSTMRTWVAPAVGLAIAIPIALAVIAAIVFVVTGVLAMWGLWLFVGWWIFGHRYHQHPGRHRYPPRGGPRGPVGTYESRRAQPRPGYWV
jgi:hypothetical protein